MANLTIKDIAKICGVGTSTVSRAINDDPGINPETKERILQVVKEFRYVPNASARNLKTIETNTIGLLVKGQNNPFFQSMYADFERELQKAGYDFTLREMSSNPTEEGLIASEMIKEKRLKGIIILGGMISSTDAIKSYIDIPYVLCTVALNAKNTQSNLVGIDDELESYKVVDYLIKKGHKKIAIIAGQKTDYAVGGKRLEGYKKALLANGIAFEPELVAYQREEIPDYSPANGYSVMQDLLDSGKDFTAVFVISDLTAVGAYKAIYDAGRKIPDDYSVVGFDGIELTNYMYPALTTVRQPVEDYVKASVDRLLKLLDGSEDTKDQIFEAELIERDSVKTITA